MHSQDKCISAASGAGTWPLLVYSLACLLFAKLAYTLQWRRKHIMTGPARPRARDYV